MTQNLSRNRGCRPVIGTLLAIFGAGCAHLAILFACVMPAFVGNMSVAAQATLEGGGVTDRVMTENRFWALIAETTIHQADSDRQIEALRGTLRELSAAEIEAFERAFERERRRAYTWDLWGAAYVLNGFASDDGFEYFQRWLISKGRKVFDAAVAHPDSLADMLARGAHGPFEFEEFAYVAGRVWAEKTGIDPWRDTKGAFPYTGGPPASQLSGTPFEKNKSNLAKKYPKLWARFGSWAWW
jgi:Protein of unknown function (DUF4240)